MIIVDKLLAARAAEARPIRVALFGAGFMARGLVRQIARSVPGLSLAAVCSRSPEKATGMLREAGLVQAVETTTDAAFTEAVRSGRTAVTSDLDLVASAEGVDAVIDATGALEYGAHLTVRALSAGKHVISMNAELDGTIGPLLATMAEEAGVIFTGCDGDQPGVQMNLVRFVQSIGLTPLVCGNIKGLHDPRRNPDTQAGFAARWGQNPMMVTSFADGTKISFEQAIVANATGMTIEVRGMRGRTHDGPVDTLTTAYDVDELRALGGVVDYVVGAKPAPGVYVLATHDDPAQRHYLDLYKLGPGPLYAFYTPYHLCHFEVPLSVARAVLCGDAVIRAAGPPQVDVVATAKVDLEPGDLLDGLGGFKTYGQCETHRVVRRDKLLPIGLSEGCRVRRRVAQDAVLTLDDVEVPEGRLIDALRARQDARFSEA